MCPADSAVCRDTRETTETQFWTLAAGHMGETCRDTDVVIEKTVRQRVCVVPCRTSAYRDTPQDIETLLAQLAFHVAHQSETDAILSVVAATQSRATRCDTVETLRDSETHAAAVSETPMAQSKDTVSRHAEGVSSLVATRNVVVHAATHLDTCREATLQHPASACRVAYLGR